MPNPNDKVKNLYNTFVKDGYAMEPEAQFRENLKDPKKRKAAYDALVKDGYNMESYSEFESNIGFAKPAPKAALKPQAQPQRPAAPAPQAKPQPTATAAPAQQKPAATAPASSRPAPAKPQQSKPSGNQPLTIAQRQTMINQVGQMMQQTQAMTADFNDRMKNMQQYGLGLNHGQTKIGGLKYNPRTGKFEQTYLTPDGRRYTSKAVADAESYRYRKAQSEPLPMQMNDAQIAAAQKPADNAVAALWKEAEAKLKADRNKNAEEVYGGSPWFHGGREMHIVDAATNAHKNEVSRLTRFDLQKMMDNAWGRVGNQMTRSCYEQLRKQYPNASEQQLQNTAKTVARQLSDNSVYKYAVAKNTPKSTLEFFAKTAADMNLLNTLTKGLARSEAGTTGDLAAYEQAMGEYGKHHRVAQIGGTILGMGLDPTTVLSMGSGSVASRAALNVGGRLMAKKAATNVGARLFGSTLKGRVVAGAVGGAANFGTYEGIKEAESQYLHGGHINAETGENEGYSAGEILKSTGRGTVLGSVTGTFSPLIGNVSDKLVKATSSTAGKAGVRLGELATSTVAEGTVFSVPEWISGNGDAMDVWTDNIAMMLGFKAQHMVKSAPRVIAGLRPVENPRTMQERNHNRMNFMERLRKQMDASPRDMDFTNEEREELRKQGYGELADLFKRTPKQKQTKPQHKPTTTDGKTMTYDIDIPEANAEDLGENMRKQWLKNHPEFDGYEAMERLVQDPTVSQSARAKAYYILTGRQLPMGTVTGYSTETDEHGNIFVKAMTADGEVVTNKRFADEASAKREQDNIMRQAELNSVDVGERHKETAANIKVVQAAVEQVAPGADFETVMRNYKAVKSGDADAVRNYGEMVKEIDKAIEANKGMADAERPEAIRAAIKEETGVDVDEAIKKGPGKRNEQEQAAVEDYIKRLFPEEKGAETGAEQPMSEDEAEAADIYDRARLTWDNVEQGDPEAKADVDDIVIRMQEAYQLCEDAFGADAEWRMAEMQEDPWAMVSNPELTEDQQDAVLYYIKAKAAMDGVQDASNDAMERKRNEVAANVERHTHKDSGTIQPATMKVDDKPVYIVKGNVAVFPDGSGIDTANSDQSIVICDAETGEYKFTSPDQIFNVGEAIDPQTELDEAYANIQAEHEAVLGGMENGESVPKSGESVHETPENVQNEGENVQQPMTDEQLQQYAQGAFNEATQGDGGVALSEEQVEGMQHHNQQMLEAEQQRKAEEANKQPTALSRVPVDEQTGEPMFERADRETALDALNEVTGGNEENTRAIVNAQLEQATKAVEALKKKAPTKKPAALKGSPMQMVKAQQEADAAYNAAMEQYNAQVGAAEESQKAWTRIYTLMNDRIRAKREQQEAEWKAKEAKLHDEAVAQVEEQKRVAAEKAAEQAAVGTHAVNPKLKAKWDAATKVEGNANAITLEDGSTLRGHYVLTEAGAATASHDVDNGYEPTEGFPIDENGESVNDRDYKRDKDAQRIVQDIANNYDSRALQSPVIVSKDGIVLSGNNRTMSGEIAARQNTDKAYTDHLKEFGQMYGFTPEQVESMKHPRVVFVPDEELPYDARTFARFNAESQKKQSKPEHAVKLGKVVPDNVFNIITGDISRYDRLSDYYADDKAVSNAISQLLGAGVINEMQLPELRTGNSLSAAGRELIENTLIGKVFQTSPDAVRQIIAQPTLRQSVVMGLNEIAHNRILAKSGYDLSGELAAAVDLVIRAKSQSPDIYKDGMPVSPFGRQAGLFDDEYGDSRVTDGVTLLLADLLNSGKPSDLRKVLSSYNQMAASPASGQFDMFSGEVTPKEQILQDTLDHFRNATPKEQQALVDAAIAERKRRAEAAAAEPSGRGEASEQTENAAGGSKGSENREGIGGVQEFGERQSDLQPEEEVTAKLSSDKTDEYGKPLVLAKDGTTTFGMMDAESGLKEAPIQLSLGENRVGDDGKNHGYGLLHIEAGHGEQIRNAGFSSVEEFVEEVAKNYADIREGAKIGDKQTYLLEMTDGHNNTLFVQLSKDGTYWNVNSAGIFNVKYSRRKPKVYSVPALGEDTNTDTSEVNSGHSDGVTAPAGNSSKTSDDKGTILPSNRQAYAEENSEKVVDSEGESTIQAQIDAASADVNTEPTEAQKEAGNYKKGHVQVGTFDITIEQPEGSIRRGTDANGKQWESKMHNTYGYFRGTEGVDGDHIDVFLSNDIDGWNGRKVYVVDQYNPDGSFDEHKVMLGFNDMDEAKSDYLANYEKGWEDGRRIDVSGVNLEDFEKWIASSHRKTKPFSEYKIAQEQDEFERQYREKLDAYEKHKSEQAAGLEGLLIEMENAGISLGSHLADQTRRNVDKDGFFIFDGSTMVYHGTQNLDLEIEDLEPSHKRIDGSSAGFNGSGVYFTPTVDNDYGNGPGQKMLSCRLKIGKPFYLIGTLGLDGEHGKLFSDILRKHGYDAVIAYSNEYNCIEGYPDEIVALRREVIVPFSEYSSVNKETVANSPATTVKTEATTTPAKEAETTNEANSGSAAYTITPATYTNKKGKTSDVSLLKFNDALTAEQERAVKEFAKERMGEGRFAPARGWKDRESGGWMFRNEEDARKAAEMVGSEEAVADAQPMTAQELREAVEPKTESKAKRTAKQPKAANKVEAPVKTEDAAPAKESKEEQSVPGTEKRLVITDQMKADEDVLRDLLGIGDDELDGGMMFRDPDGFTPEQRRKVYSAGVNYALGYIEQGFVSFPEFAKAMSSRLGYKIKPWLKSLYEGAKRIPGYEDMQFTPSDEVDRFDVENFDKPFNDVLAQANMIVEEGKAQVAADKATKELKTIRNEQRKEADEQRAADTVTVAEKARTDISQAKADAASATDRRGVSQSAERVDEALDEVNDQLALLGYYEAEQVEKDFNEAYGYMRNAEKKAVKDASNLAEKLIDDLGLDHYAATHAPSLRGGTMKKKPLAVSNISPIGGDVSIHLPLEEGRELYLTIGVEPRAAKGVDGFGGSDLEVTHIMFRVDHPEGTGNDRYGRNVFVDSNVTYSDLLKQVQREAYKYLIGSGVTNEGEYAAGDKVQYSTDGGRTWTDAVVVQPNDDGGIRIDTGLAPVMWVNAHPDQLRHKAQTEPQNEDIFQKAERIAKEAREKKAAKAASEPTTTPASTEQPKSAMKKKASKKKVKPEQPVGDLFAGLFDNTSDNGLQGNDEAVRTETVPADNSGQQQGLRESQGSPRKTAAQEGGRPDGGRGGQSTGKDRAVSAGLHGLTEPKNTRNNHSERGADHAPTSVNGRIEANIKAIELAHELLESGETATPEQMSVLRQFSGWGGLGAAFSDGGYDWKQRERNKKIRELLGEEAYEQAVMSANSAYYTPAYVVDTLWDIANQLGFKGGNILEGSAGIGNILGQMPTTVSERSNIHAIEIDGTSGGILSLLYPDAKVEIQGFEQTRIPNGSVDLAITNVPFVTGLRVNDTTGDSDLSKKFHNIHDFCIAKNVRKLREGGLGIFISSNGTLDNSKALRDWVVNEGGSDFIGAFRMNNKTFGGTTVTSDIIVIRKRVNGQKSAQAIDVSSISGERTAEYEEPGARKAKQLSMDYNKYFIEHPDHMAGEMRFAFEEGDTFRPTSKGLYPVSGKDQGKMLVDFVKSFTEEDSSKATTTDHHDVSLVLDASADGKKLGEMYMKDGQIVLASFGGYYPLEVNDKKIKGHTKQECFTAYAAIKSALADVMQYQTENESDAGLKPLIAKLNKAYDAFVNTYGHFNKNNQLAWLRNDVDYPNVFSLETYKEQGDGKGGVVKTYDKADVMKGRVVEKESEPHPENVKDGVVVSMFKNGRIDVPYIASQLGKSEAEVKREIIDSGLGFEDPTTRQMEVSYHYLSGNVREKLKQAEANNENGEYSKNIKALQDVVPGNIPAHLIDFTLGSSWLDPKLYDEYVKERTDIDVHFTAAGGTWFMKAPTYGVNVEKNRAMGIVSEMLNPSLTLYGNFHKISAVFSF